MNLYRFFVLLCMLLVLAGCGDAAPAKETSAPLGETQTTQQEATEVPFAVQFVSLFGDPELSFEPAISVVKSNTELQTYCEENHFTYAAYTDSGSITGEFAELCTGYDHAFFESKFLVLLSFCEGSISTTHEITSIVYGGGQMEIRMNAINDGFLLHQEANWCCILEIDREYLADAEGITVSITELNYPDGQPAGV